MTILSILASGLFLLNTRTTTLAVVAKQGSDPRIFYYGTTVSGSDIDGLGSSGFTYQPCYTPFGLAGAQEPAVSMIQSDGNNTLDLKITGAAVDKWEDGEILTVTSADPIYDIVVANVFKTYYDEDIIEIWAEITNGGRKSATLTRYYSAQMPLHTGDVWISTLCGSWSNEANVCQEPLVRGTKLIKNMDGVRNSHSSHAEAMISIDGKPRENDGRVIGMALEWGGNYEMRFVTDDTDYHRIFAGICPDNAPYTLAKGETFATPPVAFSFSPDGLGGVSRNFHRWGRRWRLAHGDRERKILLNSWEGVSLDINEECADQMMGDIASMGGELFVVDDGWFGDKYPRAVDNSSLGDWVADRHKIPGGIEGLVAMANNHGVRFGIWIEPEMTNTISELFEKHPDWVLKADGRELQCGRGGTQLVLDLTNPEVRDFAFGVFDRLLTENPEIDYIKWDANMNISTYGSPYLKNQSHLDIEYWRGFTEVCNRIRAKYPDVTIQACGGGGGRANWGVLPWFDEFWTSDNTDALQRLNIQWGTSYFFPAIAMGAHISAVPNHILGRVTPLKFRADVAMSGRLGMELQPKDLSPLDYAQCKRAVADYKSIRNTVQLGDLYRLHSPYEDLGVSSLMFVSEDKSDAAVMWYRTEYFYDHYVPRLRMAGLDPARTYRVVELDRMLIPTDNGYRDAEALPFEGRSFSGKFLMETGLEIPAFNLNPDEIKSYTAYSSRVLHLIAE